jgi:hypothetical protein
MTIEQELAQTKHALEVSKRGVTWLEAKVVALERDARQDAETKAGLLKHVAHLQAQIAALENQNNRLSERIFMAENVPSCS